MHLECNGVQIILFVFVCLHLEYYFKIVCLVRLNYMNCSEQNYKKSICKINIVFYVYYYILLDDFR
jgi:hypothetical protein